MVVWGFIALWIGIFVVFAPISKNVIWNTIFNFCGIVAAIAAFVLIFQRQTEPSYWVIFCSTIVTLTSFGMGLRVRKHVYEGVPFWKAVLLGFIDLLAALEISLEFEWVFLPVVALIAYISFIIYNVWMMAFEASQQVIIFDGPTMFV